MIYTKFVVKSQNEAYIFFKPYTELDLIYLFS